jgi:hypothetical protein
MRIAAEGVIGRGRYHDRHVTRSWMRGTSQATPCSDRRLARARASRRTQRRSPAGDVLRAATSLTRARIA